MREKRDRIYVISGGTIAFLACPAFLAFPACLAYYVLLWLPSSAPGGSPGFDDDGSATSGGWQIPGDSNQDGVLDVSDVVSLLVRLFRDGALELPCEGDSIDSGGNRLQVLDDDRKQSQRDS